MTEITLSVAWQWHCPLCGKRYYTGGERLQDEETMTAARAAFGADFGEYVVAAPCEVTCVKCAETFDVRNPDEDE